MGSEVDKGLNKIGNVATLGGLDMAKDMFEVPDMPEAEAPEEAVDPQSKIKKRSLQRKGALKEGSGRASTVMSRSSTLG